MAAVVAATVDCGGGGGGDDGVTAMVTETVTVVLTAMSGCIGDGNI